MVLDGSVIEAMRDASHRYVDMHDLLEKSGDHIAKLLGVEAALITSGAAAGLAISAAAAMCGLDASAARRLPDTKGLRDDFLIHRCQRNPWTQAVRLSGARLSEFGREGSTTLKDLRDAVGPSTAAILYFPDHNDDAALPLDAVVQESTTLPVIVDAAAQVPPPERLTDYYNSGAVLTVFSGGKFIGGPAGTGLLVGSREMIEACRVHSSPNYAVGRAMKVGKEEIAGFVVALENFLEQDFERLSDQWQAQATYIGSNLCYQPGFNVRYMDFGTDSVLPRQVPRIYVTWDIKDVQISPQLFADRLMARSVPVSVGVLEEGISLNPSALVWGSESEVVEAMNSLMRELSHPVEGNH
jgi:uncharacterized pyridoxal phosphate-dependent enzyme